MRNQRERARETGVGCKVWGVGVVATPVHLRQVDVMTTAIIHGTGSPEQQLCITGDSAHRAPGQSPTTAGLLNAPLFLIACPCIAHCMGA